MKPKENHSQLPSGALFQFFGKVFFRLNEPNKLDADPFCPMEIHWASETHVGVA